MRKLIRVLSILTLFLPTGMILGQDDFGTDFGDFGAFDPLAPAGGVMDQDPIEVAVEFEVAEGTNQGRVSVIGMLAPDWHIYSVTQASGGPTPTTLGLDDGSEAKLLGPFVPQEKPKVAFSDIYEMDVEEHSDRVVWTAPIELVDASAAEDAKVLVKLDGLTCKTNGSCIPITQTYTAVFKGTYAAPKPSGEYRAEDGVVTWRGEIKPTGAMPGDTVQLILTATPDDGFHVYEASTNGAENSTNFVVTQLSGMSAKAPSASTEVVEKTLPGIETPIRYHEGEVTWTIPLSIPPEAEQGQRIIEGAVNFQACTESSCRLPQAFTFSGTIQVSSSSDSSGEPLAFAKTSAPEVSDLAASTRWVTEVKPLGLASTNGINQSSLGVILGMALIGGLILNAMPCVLPVVGLKLMALVESAAEDQRKIFSHNMWYSLGLLSVFWILAGVAIAVRLTYGNSFGWGEQFTYWQFRLGLTILVFAMALSFLGTWEIPLPGFASGKASQQLQQQEGSAGAFFKGVFTTLLATPCSGPLLGVVFGFTVASPPAVTLLIFTTVGLGMALPYILIGLVPGLVRWLPKPGPWMETSKQLMAFVLLGTVAFLFAGFSDDFRVPVFVTLVGTWFGCWWIGQVPNWKPMHQRVTAWAGGIATACVIGFFSFQLLIPGEEKLDWIPYSEQRLAQYQNEGRTVMVDFTASWCVNCQVNYRIALNTDPTSELVEELDVVPMLADWTDRNAEIGRKLNELQSNAIPVLAIYPAGRPDQPIILRDLVSQEQVLDALKLANSAGETTVAAR